MDSSIIPHLFGALHTLERCITRIEKALPKRGAESIARNLPQQKAILKRMRRSANLLQLELAKENWTEAGRALRTFYGLHYLVRADILQAQKILARCASKNSRNRRSLELKEQEIQISHLEAPHDHPALLH